MLRGEGFRLSASGACHARARLPSAPDPGHSPAPRGGETETRIGPLGLNAQHLPDQAAIDRLYEERDFQRACQAYLWALPIVSYGQWQNQHETVFGAGDCDIVKYLTVRDKLGLITANATTPYVLGFVNTARTGPVVAEVPAGEIAGAFGDFWERNITDIGLTGPDNGRGGRYLLLGPGQEPPAGVKVDYEARSPTFNVFHAFRVLTTDPAAGERILTAYQLYPAKDEANPPKTRVLTPHGRPWSGTQPRGMAYWQRLNELLQIVPAKQWWSVAIYDIETRCFLDTSYDKVELGSRSGLAMNPDGSSDIYVAPRPPEGTPESNWIPSRPERAWFTYFRLYAPLQPYFDASWKLPDIKAV